jgi:hypothetical protein
MTDQEVILQALERIRRRLELDRARHDAVAVLGMVAVGLLLWRILHFFGSSAPAVAGAVLATLLLWVGALVLLARRRLAPRCTLGEAAASVDIRAGLKNELSTARWFLEHPVASPWVDAQLARAAKSARGLDSAALLPLRVHWPELSAGAAVALLLVAACLAPAVLHTSDAVAHPPPLAEAQAQQVKFIRALISEEPDEATARSLERALATLERSTATSEQKRDALLEGEAAVAQQALEAAALRDGLYRLAANLRGEPRTEGLARALERGDAQLAARLMQQLAEHSGPIGLKPQAASPAQGDDEQELASLLSTVDKDEDQTHVSNSGASAKEAADRLTRIAQQLASQEQWSQAAYALAQLRQAVAQEPSALSAGARQQAAGRGSDNAAGAAGGPNAQQAASSGPDSRPFGREGSKPGAAAGDAQSDAVLGAKVAPLAVRLRQETIDAESLGAPDAVPKEWFYVETQKRASSIELEPARPRSEFTLGQSAALEGVAVRHRQIVKEYFMALHQGARP